MHPMSIPHLKHAAPYPSIVGAVLAQLREQRGMQQLELAGKLGLSPSTWSRIERGALALTLEQLAAAADALKTSPGEILTRADKAATRIRQQGVTVRRERGTDALSEGEVLLGTAALIVLIAAACGKLK